MTGKRAAKKQALRDRLVDAAEAQMMTEGLKGLRARDIAKEAGCALGSVYTAFRDLDELALTVNMRTASRLDIVLAEARNSTENAEEQLMAMADHYHQFALEDYHLWVALFDHHLQENEDLPEWYQSKHFSLFRHVELSLQQLCPNHSQEQTAATARTLFSAVHGIITINMHARFIAISPKELTRQLHSFLTIYIDGLKQQSMTGEKLGKNH